jgi:hypothetical protein
LKWVHEIPDKSSASASVLMIVATCYHKKNAQT